MPRPTKLTPELARSVIELVLSGVPPLTAARAHGIPEATWYEWLARGRGNDPDRPQVAMANPYEPFLYAEFAEAIDAAVPAFEVGMVNLAVRKARSTAEALAILERHPATRAQWRPPARTVEQATTISGPDGGPIRVEVARPETEQELRARIDSLLDFVTDLDPQPVGDAEEQAAGPQRGATQGGPSVP